MKDQYFGDVNDFRKYGLLRALVLPVGLRLGVCWMLTEPDGRTDGNFLAYLTQPETYRRSDPALFDWLKQVIQGERNRRTVRIEKSGLLGSAAAFQSSILTDRGSERSRYFSECAVRFAGYDLLFFDPDTGLEVRSVLRGHKGSRGYLYWDEACDAFAAGASVVIYRHFPREKHSEFTARITNAMKERTGAAAVISFRTPHLLFLLASQERHLVTFRKRLTVIQSIWAPARMVAVEHH